MKSVSGSAALAILVLFAGCQPKAPVIYSIHPQIGKMGEPVTITGSFFGNEREESSYITLAGAQPTSMSYLSWNDQQITFRVPEFGEAGLIYVHVKGRKSNGMLFSNQATLPRKELDSELGQGPRVVSITPQAGAIGALVSITGTGFGSSRGDSGVFFSWSAEMPASIPTEARIPEFAEVPDYDFGYELWSEREIRVHIPDGAISGSMEVRTARGSSLPMYFEVANRPGTKTFRDKRSYTFHQNVNVRVMDAELPNTMFLWVPRPAASAAQRNIELLSVSMEPFVDSHLGTSLFKLDDLRTSSEVQINLAWKVEVHSVETTVRPQSLRQQNSQISDAYTLSSPQLPSGDPWIRSQVNAIIGRERNPYVRAQKIYEWMIGQFMFHMDYLDNDIFAALEKKQADPYTAALLYCTLLRAAGIPCLPVAGVLVSRDRQTMNHWWAEFWIDGLGWIPVDVLMGAEAVPPQFSSHPDRASYYFGNIDSLRIAFSRGFTNLSPMDPRGRTVMHSRSYSLQNLWEEVVNGIDSYSSLWGSIIITGMYAQ